MKTTETTIAESVICPRSRTKLLVLDTHRQAHLWATKTLLAIKVNWYLPGMMGLVRRLVRKCAACQGSKAPSTRNRARNHLSAVWSWQVLTIDFFVPIPQTQSGNNGGLVMTDHFTCWCNAIQLPDGKAATVARALNEQVFACFGIPGRCVASSAGVTRQRPCRTDHKGIWLSKDWTEHWVTP